MELAGDRVTLRELEESDVLALLEFGRDPGFARWWPDLDATSLVRAVGRLREYERSPDGTWRDGLLMDLLAAELT